MHGRVQSHCVVVEGVVIVEGSLVDGGRDRCG